LSSPDDGRPEAPPPGEDAPAVDERRAALLDRLVARLGDAVVESHLLPGKDLWARVRTDAWGEAARVCRDDLGLTYFCFLSAIDWSPSPYGKSEDDSVPAVIDPSAPLDHGFAGGDTRFQLLARLEQPGADLGLTLKADVADGELAAPTWTDTFAGANWHEREAHEMFGISFVGHPNLINLYLPGAFEGFPLRKDFPLLARMVKPWPGLVDVEPMPGEPDDADADAEAEAVE
jgi:NADH-quinone oxidoreductase subunit C